jgi:protein TonB
MPPAATPNSASAPPAPEAPRVDLAGTDDFTAIASGQGIIPAAPDRRYRNDPPRYPPDAARLDEQGGVVVLIHVLPDGAVGGAEVVDTSGFASLDNAALVAVRLWHFLPALKDGRAVPFDMPFRFVFEGE